MPSIATAGRDCTQFGPISGVRCQVSWRCSLTCRPTLHFLRALLKSIACKLPVRSARISSSQHVDCSVGAVTEYILLLSVPLWHKSDFSNNLTSRTNLLRTRLEFMRVVQCLAAHCHQDLHVRNSPSRSRVSVRGTRQVDMGIHSLSGLRSRPSSDIKGVGKCQNCPHGACQISISTS